jgi:hypothetical protein
MCNLYILKKFLREEQKIIYIRRYETYYYYYYYYYYTLNKLYIYIYIEEEEEEEEEPTRCYLVFYYTYDRLNIFLASLCPSSGAHYYTSDYHMGCLFL